MHISFESQCLGIYDKDEIFYVQRLSTPANLDQLSEELAERHSTACQQQTGRLETAYRAFASACIASETEPQGSATLNQTAAEMTTKGNARSSNNANTQSSVERSLRDAISIYFSAEDDIYINSESQTPEDGPALPLKSAEPMLGADARALIMQINKTAQCPVGNSILF